MQIVYQSIDVDFNLISLRMFYNLQRSALAYFH